MRRRANSPLLARVPRGLKTPGSILSMEAGSSDPAWRRFARVAVAAVLLSIPTQARQPQTPQRSGQPPADATQGLPTFRSGRDLVVVNVVVRDKNGKLVRGLKQADFTVTEDNKPQTVESFDFEELDTVAAPVEIAGEMLAGVNKTAPARSAAGSKDPAYTKDPTATKPLAGSKDPAYTKEPIAARQVVDLSDRRLMVLFFDLSSMQPDEVVRAVASGRDYVEKRLSPADVISVVSLGTSLNVAQDFTSDRASLLAALDKLSPAEGSGFTENQAVSADDAADTGDSFTPDETEFNIFNTDRRLDALRALADVLAGIEQKKSVIYFSGGVTQQGMDNQAAMRAVVDRAVRANLSIYAADTRGLQALPAGGEASSASARGQGAFSGRTMDNARESLSGSQDSLTTLAEDTGGRAFFDTNEFSEVYAQVVKDTTAYYLLGYTSTNTATDGRYRRIKVALKQPGYKLEFRSGYYAPRDFSHSGRDDREQQLQEQLLSDLSPTDLPVHGTAGYFRLKPNRYYVPMSFIVPGSQVQFSRSSDKEKATLDVLGVIRDPQKRIVAWIRDTVKLAVAATADVRRKNVQYDTSFELPPGRYNVKLVIRENQLGTVGSIETSLVVPDIEREPLKISSVLLSTQHQPASPKKGVTNPLLVNGQLLTPNVAHVVTASQPMSFFFEVYDPASPGGAAAARVLSNVSCYRGTERTLQTDVTAFDRLNAPDRKALRVELEVAPNALPPGLYSCQVNIIDDAAGLFAFPRIPLYVRK
jgi:VWFA-related protein